MALPKPKTKPYNPYAYVPGGSSPAVSAAIQAKGYAKPGPNPVQIPQVPTGVGAPVDTTPDSGFLGGAWGGQPGGAKAIGSTPELTLQDYQNRIRADPMWDVGQTGYDTALARGKETIIRDPFRIAQIAFGGLDMNSVPEQYRAQVQDLLDPTTLETARTNPTSTMALLAQGLGRDRAAIPYQLKGQRTGGAAVMARRLAEANQLRQNQALQTLLGVLTQGQGQFATYADQARRDWETIQQGIADRIARQAENTPPDTTQDMPDDWIQPPSTYQPPTYGNEAGYTPAGTYNTTTGQIDAPGGGAYTRQGGGLYYQSKKGPYGYKPQY